MEDNVVRMYRFKKILKFSILTLFIFILALLIYEYFRITPYNVHFTNISSNSITLSWNTKMPIDASVVRVEANNKIPIKVLPFLDEKFYDTRDVKAAELEATRQSRENIIASDSSEIQMNDIETEIKVDNRGKYYTHHVEIKGLDSEKEYSFLVGDSLIYRRVEDTNGLTFIKTSVIPKSITTPYPIYGSVKNANGEDEIPLENLLPVKDGVLYLNYYDELTGERSNIFSSVLNESGNWYIDASNALDKSGQPFVETYRSIDNELLLEFVVDGGDLGVWKKTDIAAISTPTKPIVINMPNNIETDEVPQKIESMVSTFIKGISAETTYVHNNCYFEQWCGPCRLYTETIPGNSSTGNFGGAWSCTSGTPKSQCESTLKARNCAVDYQGNPVDPPTDPEGPITCANGIYKLGDVVLYAGDCKECQSYLSNGYYIGKLVVNNTDYDQSNNCAKKVVKSQAQINCEDSGGTWTSSSCNCGTKKLNTTTQKCEAVSTSAAQTNCVNSGGEWKTDYDPLLMAPFNFCYCSPKVLNSSTQKCEAVSTTTEQTNCTSSGGTWSTSTSKCTCPASKPLNTTTQKCTTSTTIDAQKTLCINSGGEWNASLVKCACPSDKPLNSATLKCTEIPVDKKALCTSTGGTWATSCTCGAAKPSYTSEFICVATMNDLKGFCDKAYGTWNGSSCTCNDPSKVYDKSTRDCIYKSDETLCKESSGTWSAGKCICPENWTYTLKRCIKQDTDKCWEGADGMVKVDGDEFYKCSSGNWVLVSSSNAMAGSCYKFLDNPANFYCTNNGTYCYDAQSGKTYQCYKNSWTGGEIVEDELIATDRIPIHAGEECKVKACYCDSGIDKDKQIENGEWCREIKTSECKEDGKQVCNISGSTCKYQKLEFGSEFGTYTSYEWLCIGPKKTTSSSNFFDQNKSILSLLSPAKAQAEELLEEEYIIDFETGLFTGIKPGTYSFEKDGQVYFFDVSESSLLANNGGVLIYMDKNENGAYDEGIDTKVSTLGSTLKIKTIEQKYRYNLSKGYNFVSLPYLVSSDEYRTAASLLKKLNEVYGNVIYSIAKYDGSWKIVGENIEAYDNNNFQLLPGQGYIIRSKENISIIINGKPIKYEGESDKAPITLFKGWNLIGLYGSKTKQYTADSLIKGINGYTQVDFTADNVSKWESDTQRYDGYQVTNESGVDIEYGFDFPINLLQSYFVRVQDGSGNWQPEYIK